MHHDRWRVAVHEAGHVVAGRWLGVPVSSASVLDSGGGRTVFAVPPGQLRDPTRVYLSQAGRAAEDVLIGPAPAAMHAHSTDYSDCWRAAARYSRGSAADAAGLISAVREQLYSFMYQNLPLVSAVASVLATKGDITADEIDTIIRAAIAGRVGTDGQLPDGRPLTQPGQVVVGGFPTSPPIDPTARYRPL